MTGGWGVSNYIETEPSRYLRKIKMNVTTDIECIDKYPRQIDSSFFCGEQRDGGSINNVSSSINIGKICQNSTTQSFHFRVIVVVQLFTMANLLAL